jgi:hypothetical protein
VELTGTATSIVHGLSPAAEYRLMNMERKKINMPIGIVCTSRFLGIFTVA